MASNMYKLIWGVLFLFVLLLSATAIARNHAATSELHTSGNGKRLAGQPCRKLSSSDAGPPLEITALPRGHNYRIAQQPPPSFMPPPPLSMPPPPLSMPSSPLSPLPPLSLPLPSLPPTSLSPPLLRPLQNPSNPPIK
ncbi:hypothetical protein L6164_017581 [Bauhinia variegata]|uniref:Uncharacterized protein n=1 Tax=Bauhinia variegata TaxID=167791 RepID=A0ACB9N8K6_BAUVA|nr:hypothetical protein L6164_017581 [Bauhinia variegata]